MRIRRSGLPAARPQARFDALPATVDLSPSRTVAVSQILLAALAVIFVVLFRMKLDPAAAPSTNPTVSAITTGISLVGLGLGLLSGARGVFLLLSRREARFDGSSVRVTGRTPLGREEWSAPLSAFRGVTRRTVRRRRRGPPRVFQVIELAHPDTSRTLPLRVRQSRHDARAEWESLARSLGVPAIDDRDGAGHARAAEDLDKSVRDLAAEGRTRSAWQPGSESPAGLSWESAGSGDVEALIVRLHARRFPLWLYAAAAAIGALLLFVGFRDGAILGTLIAAAMIGVLAWFWFAEPRNPRELRITRAELSVSDPLLLAKGPTRLPLDAIEEIRVAPPPGRLAGAGTLVIASDQGEIRTGHGLSREALEWLNDYLTAAVAEA